MCFQMLSNYAVLQAESFCSGTTPSLVLISLPTLIQFTYWLHSRPFLKASTFIFVPVGRIYNLLNAYFVDGNVNSSVCTLEECRLSNRGAIK